VRLWNSQTGTQLRSIPAEAAAFAVSIDAPGKRVAAGGADGLLRLWDTTTGRPLLTLWSGPGGGKTDDWLAITPEGYYVASDLLAAAAVWLTGGSRWTDPAVRDLLAPGLVARAARGEKLPEPKLR
jgi:WD40 repeat protein